MQNNYYTRIGWSDGYYDRPKTPHELGYLTQDEIEDYSEGLYEGMEDFAKDRDDEEREYYHEK